MSMEVTVSAATSGYDDAEAVAATLELIAVRIREAGGDPVTITGDIEAPNGNGTQTVFVRAGARP